MERLIPSVQAAGAAIMRHYRRAARIRLKADGSPVTIADKAAEEIILHALADCAPDIPVISEENEASHALAPSGRFFLVDALDGTRDFARTDSRGWFTVNVGLVEGGDPVAGIVFAPVSGRLFHGARGVGAREVSGGRSRSIRARAAPGGGALALTSHARRTPATSAWLAAHGVSRRKAVGSSLKFALLASGEADVYPRYAPTMEWDTAAGDAILRAAGGHVVSLPGMKPFRYGKQGWRNGAFVALGAGGIIEN